jgi:hypothetical protein
LEFGDVLAAIAKARPEDYVGVLSERRTV